MWKILFICRIIQNITTKIEPLDAVKKENHLWVNWHLQNNAKKDRKYPKINEGDMVRVNIYKKRSLRKVMDRIGVQQSIKLLV